MLLLFSIFTPETFFCSKKCLPKLYKIPFEIIKDRYCTVIKVVLAVCNNFIKSSRNLKKKERKNAKKVESLYIFYAYMYIIQLMYQ